MDECQAVSQFQFRVSAFFAFFRGQSHRRIRDHGRRPPIEATQRRIEISRKLASMSRRPENTPFCPVPAACARFRALPALRIGARTPIPALRPIFQRKTRQRRRCRRRVPNFSKLLVEIPCVTGYLVCAILVHSANQQQPPNAGLRAT